MFIKPAGDRSKLFLGGRMYAVRLKEKKKNYTPDQQLFTRQF